MKDSAFRFAPLGAEHDRGSFHFGEETLDRYLLTQATQDILRRVAKCFVAVEITTGAVAGYYTIAAASIPLVERTACLAIRHCPLSESAAWPSMENFKVAAWVNTF